MLTANEARKRMGKEVAINECKRRTEERIMGAVERGLSEVVLADTKCFVRDGKTIGDSSDVLVDCEYEIKEWLRTLGYRIEPMGYAYGTWNDVDLIKW